MTKAKTPRPDNREVENENLRPAGDGKPPRPATEKPGAKPLKGDTDTDPGSGRAR
jgi:hypothetical protein